VNEYTTALPRSLALAACSVLLAAAPARGDEEDYVRAELYPAQVRSFDYAGEVFDADRPFTIGYWTVSFGPSLPNAIFHADPAGGSEVEIQDLVCTDEGLGTFGCGFSFPAEGACLLLVDVPEGTFDDQFDAMPDWQMIGCPTSIELAR
jgi:hypothetical protein